MITSIDIRKSSQLLHAIGEHRHGYLSSSAAGVEGHYEKPRTIVGDNGSCVAGEMPTVIISVDPITGDVIADPVE
jgi:hypothetical protein